MAANQVGKTVAGGAEVAYHLTGRYPEGWNGAEFPKAIHAWVGGVTNESTRDNPQRILLGKPSIEELWGTGMVPKDAILDWTKARGTPNLVDSLVVRWGGGGDIQADRSTLLFKSYEKGREKWQGDTVDIVWFDEEPPQDVYSEGRTRTNNGQLGIQTMITFTPLLGMSEVVRGFLSDAEDDASIKRVVKATIDDAVPYIYTREQADAIIESYPEHEKRARAQGLPVLGSGRIFPVDEARIKWDLQDLPDHFVYLAGCDFGWDHPQAWVKCAVDRDNDAFYVLDAWKESQMTPVLAAARVRQWGEWLPISWPHDGLAHDKGSGKQLRAQYADQGLTMMPTHAQFSDGSTSVEAGLMEMLDAMQTGRFHVASHLEPWFDEFRLYHRENGKVVKEYDDIMSATRYAWMMRRHAVRKGGHQYQDNGGASRRYSSGGWMR